MVPINKLTSTTWRLTRDIKTASVEFHLSFSKKDINWIQRRENPLGWANSSISEGEGKGRISYLCWYFCLRLPWRLNGWYSMILNPVKRAPICRIKRTCCCGKYKAIISPLDIPVNKICKRKKTQNEQSKESSWRIFNSLKKNELINIEINIYIHTEKIKRQRRVKKDDIPHVDTHIHTRITLFTLEVFK